MRYQTKQLKIKVFCDVMLCHWTSSSWRWEGLLRLQNVRNYLSNDTAQPPRRLICSNTTTRTSNLKHTYGCHGHAEQLCVGYCRVMID